MRIIDSCEACGYRSYQYRHDGSFEYKHHLETSRMLINFGKLRMICSAHIHQMCTFAEDDVELKNCTEANCPLKATDVSIVMANDAVRNMHVVTDNSETLKNALSRIAMLEKKIKSYYCNCDLKEIRIDQVPTCECCNRPIFVEEG